MCYRVFGATDALVSPAILLEHLHAQGFAVVGHFRGDDLGWTGGELQLGIGSPVYINRFLTGEDELRDDLNSWAAWLETMDYEPNHAKLMERVIQTKQLITLRKPVDHSDDVALEKLCEGVCRYLAAQLEGFYQIDDVGWFAPDGEILLQEY